MKIDMEPLVAQIVARVIEEIPRFEPPKLVSVSQAAESLGMPDKRIRKLIHDGEVPAIRDGRCYRIAPKDLQVWIDRNKTSGGG